MVLNKVPLNKLSWIRQLELLPTGLLHPLHSLQMVGNPWAEFAEDVADVADVAALAIVRSALPQWLEQLLQCFCIALQSLRRRRRVKRPLKTNAGYGPPNPSASTQSSTNITTGSPHRGWPPSMLSITNSYWVARRDALLDFTCAPWEAHRPGGPEQGSLNAS